MDDSLRLLAITAVFLLYTLSLYGWGRLAERVIGVRWTFPITICIGLALVVFVGGWINLAGVVDRYSLDFISLIGVASALVDLRALHSSWRSIRRGSASALLMVGAPSAVLIVAVFGFTALTQVPPSVMNHGDDFHTYLLYPVHLLATGHVDAGILSNI